MPQDVDARNKSGHEDVGESGVRAESVVLDPDQVRVTSGDAERCLPTGAEAGRVLCRAPRDR